MIPGLLKREVPQWLDRLLDVKVLPIESLLENSLYYASSARDGDRYRPKQGIEDAKDAVRWLVSFKIRFNI